MAQAECLRPSAAYRFALRSLRAAVVVCEPCLKHGARKFQRSMFERAAHWEIRSPVYRARYRKLARQKLLKTVDPSAVSETPSGAPCNCDPQPVRSLDPGLTVTVRHKDIDEGERPAHSSCRCIFGVRIRTIMRALVPNRVCIALRSHLL
jgi:hypothetical protein